MLGNNDPTQFSNRGFAGYAPPPPPPPKSFWRQPIVWVVTGALAICLIAGIALGTIGWAMLSQRNAAQQPTITSNSGQLHIGTRYEGTEHNNYLNENANITLTFTNTSSTSLQGTIAVYGNIDIGGSGGFTGRVDGNNFTLQITPADGVNTAVHQYTMTGSFARNGQIIENGTFDVPANGPYYPHQTGTWSATQSQ